MTQSAPVARGAHAGAAFDGWRIVVAAFLIQGVSLGCLFSSYGLFLEPIEQEFGASRAQTLLGMSILNLMIAACGPVVGRAIDLRSIRSVMLLGAGGLVAGFIGVALATSLWQIGLVLALVSGVGAAMVGPLPATTLVANWFVRRRGTALGIAATGATTAGMLMPPLTALLLAGVGWRQTLAVYAGLCVIVLVPVIWTMVVRRPEDVGQHPDGRPPAPGMPAAAVSATPVLELSGLLRQPNFWLIAVIFGLGFSCTTTLLANLVPFAGAQGVAPARGSLLLSCAALFSLLGKLLFGGLVDRIDMRSALWLSLGLQAVAWLGLLRGPGFPLLLPIVALYGLGMGGLWPMHGALVGAAFGRQTFGQVLGAMGPAMLPFSAGLPPLAGLVFDRSGSYFMMFAPFLGVLGVVALLLVFVRIPEHEPGEQAALGSAPHA